MYISEDDVDPNAVVAAAEGGEGTIVKCSFRAVALSPNLKSQYASAQMVSILVYLSSFTCISSNFNFPGNAVSNPTFKIAHSR